MLFSIIKFVARPLLRVLFSFESHGVENVPEDGAVIIAGNHPSYLDPLLAGLPIIRLSLKISIPISVSRWEVFGPTSPSKQPRGSNKPPSI
jgi:1-acyl-sn-glycerol-3-phosphate acyltransferase